MATNLGDVFIELRIDTKKAERELDEMERKVKTSDKQRREKRPGEKRTTSDTSGFDREIDIDIDAPERQRKQRRGDKKLARRLRVPRPTRRRGLIERGVTRRVAGVAERAAGGRVPFVSGLMGRRMAAAGVAARVGGVAAAIYLGARTAAHVAPMGAEFLEGATGGAIPDPITTMAKKARARFQEFEANIKALYTGARRTLEFQGASARISGEIPRFGAYYGAFQRIEADTDRLNKRFDDFKNDQIIQAWGRLMGKTFSKDISN